MTRDDLNALLAEIDRLNAAIGRVWDVCAEAIEISEMPPRQVDFAGNPLPAFVSAGRILEALEGGEAS